MMIGPDGEFGVVTMDSRSRSVCVSHRGWAGRRASPSDFAFFPGGQWWIDSSGLNLVDSPRPPLLHSTPLPCLRPRACAPCLHTSTRFRVSSRRLRYFKRRIV